MVLKMQQKIAMHSDINIFVSELLKFIQTKQTTFYFITAHIYCSDRGVRIKT